MRIGLVVYGSLDVMTGGNVFDRMLVAHLRNSGDQVEVISLKRRGALGCMADNLTLGFDPDLEILLQDELTHASLLLPNSRRRSIPVVSIVHNLRSSEPGPAWQNAALGALERRYLDSVDGLIVNSRATLDSVRHGLDVERPSIIASPGGDRLGSLTPDAVSEREYDSGPLRLIFLANLTALKGLHVLLAALALLNPSNFELDVVGSCEVDPAYTRRVRRQAARLDSRVVFHGTLDGKSLVERLTSAHVLIIPSFYEGFGIAFLEGMAFGLPAIGARVGAIPEMISPDQNGFLIAPGDYRGLAAHLAALEMDRDRLARMSACALAYFNTRPTWQDAGRSVREFLIRLLDSRSSQTS